MENQIKLIGYFTDLSSAQRHAASINLEVLPQKEASETLFKPVASIELVTLL
jgi:hypothetical protein